MSIKVSITDLLQAIGSDNIRYQSIAQSMEGIKSKQGVTVVSFATDAITMTDVAMNAGPNGFVVWVDRELTSQRLAELKSGHGMTYTKLLQQRDELLAALEEQEKVWPIREAGWELARHKLPPARRRVIGYDSIQKEQVFAYQEDSGTWMAWQQTTLDEGWNECPGLTHWRDMVQNPESGAA